MIIFHLTTRQAWEKARLEGLYESPTLHFEGFIHCLRARQVEENANYFYKGIPDMALLCIDVDKLHWELRWEQEPRFNDQFPHIYGPIDPEAVVKVLKFDHDDEGFFHKPAGLDVWAEGLAGNTGGLDRKTGPRPVPPTEQEPIVPPTSPFTVPIRDNTVYDPDFIAQFETHPQSTLPEIEDPVQDFEKVPIPTTKVNTGSLAAPLTVKNVRLGKWMEQAGVLAWAFFMGLAAALQPGMLARSAQIAGLDRQSHGGIVAAGMLALALAAPLGGFVADRFGRRKTAAAGTILMIAAILISTAASTVFFYASQVLFSLGIGLTLPALLAFGMELKKQNHINLAAALILALFLLPTVLSSGSSASFGWVLAFALLALLVGGGLVFAGQRLSPSETTDISGKSSRAGLILVCLISLVIGGTWAATGLLSTSSIGVAEEMPNFSGLYPILILIFVLGICLSGLLTDWIGKTLARAGRSEMAAPAMAVLAAIFIPVGFSLLIMRSTSLGLLLGLLGIFFGIGLIRPVLLTSAVHSIGSGSWAFAAGLQIGIFELGSWLYLLAAGSVSNFSILLQGIMWAAVCGLLGLLGTTAAVVTAAVRTKKK